MPHKNKEVRREYLRKYRAKHRDKILEQTRAQSREWSRLHPEVQKKWKLNNPEKVKEIGREYNLKKNGWSIESFEDVLFIQDNKCWICEIELTRDKGSGNTAHADHNHKTGKKRGILCAKCNLIEGHLNNATITPVEFIKKLEEYYSTFDVEENKDEIHGVAGD